MRLNKSLLILVLSLTAAACAEVKPWQRSVLASDGMQPIPDALESYAKEHTYLSKEAASGGAGIGGGGCGCN